MSNKIPWVKIEGADIGDDKACLIRLCGGKILMVTCVNVPSNYSLEFLTRDGLTIYPIEITHICEITEPED